MKNKNCLWGIFLVVGIFLFPMAASAQGKTLTISTRARGAINNLARDILIRGNDSKITDIKSQLDPIDYATVKTIKVLPNNPLYAFKYIRNRLRLFFTFDPREKTHLLLQIGNEKTLESLLTLEQALKEKNLALRKVYVNISARVLDSVGRDFDYVAKNIDFVEKDEAFNFAGTYLKHQVLLQQEEDRLSEKDFLKIESVRLNHLQSLAHIVVLGNANPETVGKQLARIVSPQVGINYRYLATAAVLRDLENSALSSDRKPLQVAQNSLLKEFELKISNLSKKQRISEIERYASFIHGNPIRQFQVYNQISRSFTSKEMRIVTSRLKNKAAQNLKKHLNVLDSPEIQMQFVQTLFSEFPLDLRILFYTEVQLVDPKVLAVSTSGRTDPKNEVQIINLTRIKEILGSEICRNFGQDPERLAQTRFYTQSIKNPDILDVKIGEFLVDSIKGCSKRSDETMKLVTDLREAIDNNFIKEAKLLVLSGNKLLTKLEAEEILKEEGIEVAPRDEQKVAQLIDEEVKQIEKEASTPETIVEKVVALEEPVQGEITQKEEQIVEEIVDAAETGEISPLVQELPADVQEEITQGSSEAAGSLSPTATIPVTTPTLAVIKTSPTPTPTFAPTPTDDPTLMEMVESSAPSPMPVEMTAPAP